METYHGMVRSPMDAIILFEACRQGLLPRVQRRLSEKERQSIKSGSIFVWDEREAGMRRWTDGKSWSASRVSGSFLCYREMEGKRGGGSTFPSIPAIANGKSPDHGSESDSDNKEGLSEGYRYKPDGLMKQSFSITTSTNQKLHLISYYARSQNMGELKQPSTDPQLKHIIPQPGVYPEQTLTDPPPQPQMHQPLPIAAPPVHPVAAAPRSMLPSPFPPTQPPSQAPHVGPEMQPPQLPAVSHLQGFGTVTSQMPSPYGWPPSPISTPPTNFPPNNGYPSSAALPVPLTSPPAANAAVTKGPYEPSLPAPPPPPPGYPIMSSPLHYDQQQHPTLQPLPSPLPHRPSMPSSIHLHPPGGASNFHHSPLPLLPPESSRYSSPGSASSAFPNRTPPRPVDPWEPPANFSAEPGATVGASLDVQDIPNEKLGFGEDERALRQLNRASFTHFGIR
ncbi:hypothetical protein Dda_2350 [Drechslerella dactyloides]|uniref:cAMP-independent regulatory protein pac2 n=1 Tax=Drechslerella dactyloides TaxID=74499 RepID=A0AAD6J578_DREDA|nr:hypothetical protein Dda_2350 [Drechslerella dactyloides]